ncbi:hypothetical protein VTP01DRAFT_542 [Rhizomucor pusillus]|uniref:uncharacterized protein n=1 Tax=Rhizomucor pusillus TaxID=4840 RepID=UPI0037440FA0
MYSPTQQQFHMDAGNAQSSNSPHTTVGAVPVARSNRVMPSYQHQRQGSFGAASIAMSPTGPGRSIQFGDQSWLGTSVDSTGSSFGQSPPFYGGGAAGRDLVVSPSNSTSQLEGITGDEEDPLAQRHLQEIFEKRRRRRESHNAVERRRRDNINERIHELCSLLPDHLIETAPTSSNVMTVPSQNGQITRAINKGTILKLSVDHIKELQAMVTRYHERIQELEHMIENIKNRKGVPENANFANEIYSSQKPMQSPIPTMQQNVLAQQQQHQQQQHPSEPVRLVESSTTRERAGSIQFQQQFGNLHIAPSHQQQS